MTTDEIAALIAGAIPGAQVEVMEVSGGEAGKYAATVVSERFAGLSIVKQHQLVYAALGPQIQSGRIHALDIRTRTP
jgi:acid stress-induced BolA-like protein IbaG/YrbA